MINILKNKYIMKKLTILFAICIALFACEKKDDGNGYKLISHFSLDSTRIDKNNYSTNAIVALNGSLSSFVDEPNGIGKVGSCLNLLHAATLECRENLFFNYKSEYRKIKDYSISFWFKIRDRTGEDPNIFYCSSNDTTIHFLGPDFLGIALRNDSLVIAHPDRNIIPGFIKFKSITFNKIDWNHVVVTCNSNYNVYLNGSLIYTASRITSGNQYLNFVQIGNAYLNAGIYMYVDELMVYNHPISSIDVTNYYNATK
jgi:hypothetical protein